jgi:small subunit ribosomal protein S9
MTEEPQQPEGEAPEDEAPEGAPGEPGESTPSETAPEPEEAPAEETPADETPADAEAPGPEIEGLEELGQAATAQGAEEPAADDAAEPAPEEAAEPAPEAAKAAPDEAAEPAPDDAAEPAPRERKGKEAGGKDEVIPGAHLEPDLVLEEQRSEGGEYDEYGEYVDADAAAAEDGEPSEEGAEPAPVAHTPLELAADARYNATGKRKSAIARVILKPGEGTYTVNGRHLDEYFPRVRLQRMASQPLEAAGYANRMDVVARIHGGGVSAQANALRHGIARALVEADPALRTELKRRGYLTRDPREKERKKAGLKKARKRPQFSKR